jgi:hypothetical protein
MSAASAELTSMATTVSDLVARLGPIGDAYLAGHREDLASEVHEAERALNAAVRRLTRLAGMPGA